MSQKQTSGAQQQELREFVKIASEHRDQGAEILAKLDQILEVPASSQVSIALSEIKAQLDRIESNLGLLLPIPESAQERLSQEEQLKPPAGHLSQIHQHSLPVVG
jgi:hypothetical protein